MRIAVFSVLALGMLTAACGSDTTQRSATGTLAGVGVGAAVGGPIGAVVGGVVGAAGGAAMPEGADQIAASGLQKERSSSRSVLAENGLAPAAGSSAQASTAQAVGAPSGVTAGEVRQAQAQLQRQGYYHGRLDGIDGAQTKSALSTYQQHEGLQQTGELDQQTMQHLGVPTARAAMTQGSSDHNTTAAGEANGTSAAQLSPSQLRAQLQQQGYSDVSDLSRNADNTWSARAEHGGQTVALRVDAQTGNVVSEQTAASNSAPANGNAAPDATSGSSTPSDSGGDNNNH